MMLHFIPHSMTHLGTGCWLAAQAHAALFLSTCPNPLTPNMDKRTRALQGHMHPGACALANMTESRCTYMCVCMHKHHTNAHMDSFACSISAPTPSHPTNTHNNRPHLAPA